MPDLLYAVLGDCLYVRPGDINSIRAFTPPPDCPLPESERLANYLMRFFAVLDEGGYRFCAPVNVTDQRNEAFLSQVVSQSIYSVCSYIEMCIGNGLLDPDTGGRFLQNIVEKLTLIEVEFNAIKLQIDRLYVDTINISGDASGATTELEKIRKVLSTGLVRAAEQGETDFLHPDVDGRVSHIESLEQTLAGIELADDVTEVGSAAIYWKQKIVRE